MIFELKLFKLSFKHLKSLFNKQNRNIVNLPLNKRNLNSNENFLPVGLCNFGSYRESLDFMVKRKSRQARIPQTHVSEFINKRHNHRSLQLIMTKMGQLC